MMTVSSCAQAAGELASSNARMNRTLFTLETESRQLQLPADTQIPLRLLNQFPDAPRVGLSVSMTRQRIGAAGGFNQNVSPNDSGLDVDGRDLADADADFVTAEPRAFVADDGLVRHLDDGGKQEIPVRPPACLECLRCHDTS